MALEKVMYTAKAKATGGRDGRAVSSNGALDVALGLPKEMGGADKGTNPEQLFAAGYAACFLSALKHVASTEKVSVPKDAYIDAEVSIGQLAVGFGLQVTLNVHLEGMEQSQAEQLVNTAHTVCPYSNATRGNIDVTLNVIV